MLELKQGDRARVQAVMAEFQFRFSSKLKIWSFHCIVVVRGLQRNVQKSVKKRAELLCCSIFDPLLFFELPLPSSSKFHNASYVLRKLTSRQCMN